MPTGPEGSQKIVLDTSAYSRLRSGDERALDAVAAADVVWVPTVALGELEAGFTLGSRRRENSVLFEELLSEPFVSLRPVSRDVARRYGELYAELRRAGTPIPINDVWIAATALDCGGTLVSSDEHFAKVAGLRLLLLD